MAFSVNKVILLGNITREPELRYTGGGTPVCTLNMATNRSIKDQNTTTGWKDIATFHKVIVWGKAGERAAQIPPGAKVYIEGRVDNRSYEKDGVKKYITEIVAEQVIDCTSRKQPGSNSSKPEAAQQQDTAPEITPEMQAESEQIADDIPF